MVFSIASGRSANSSVILPRGLEIMLGAQTPPLVHRDIASFGDADQRVMRLEIIGAGEIGSLVATIGRSVVVGEIEQKRLGRPLLRQAMPLELDIEPVAEDAFK